MDYSIDERTLCRARDEWFARLQDFFDGKTAYPGGFPMLGSIIGPDESTYTTPEEWVDRCLDDIARNRASAVMNQEKFVPVGLWCFVYGVHFMDKILGGHVYAHRGQWNCDYLRTPIGSLEEPDLLANETFQIALRAAQHFARVGGDFPIFGLPVIASPLNIGLNLYGQELLIAMLEEPESARKDLETINRTLIRAHRIFRENIPPKQLQCPVPDTRTQPPGYGQICGCSTHLLSGDLYRDMVADLDDSLLSVYPKGGMIHLCGGHTQHIEVFRRMKHLKTIQLNDRAAGDLKAYFEGTREDQIIYLNPCPEMPSDRALEITGGKRLVILA